MIVLLLVLVDVCGGSSCCRRSGSAGVMQVCGAAVELVRLLQQAVVPALAAAAVATKMRVCGLEAVCLWWDVRMSGVYHDVCCSNFSRQLSWIAINTADGASRCAAQYAGVKVEDLSLLLSHLRTDEHRLKHAPLLLMRRTGCWQHAALAWKLGRCLLSFTHRSVCLPDA
jgi:hypothetical protein